MEDDEEIAILVCMPAETPSPFPDNLVGDCDRCGRKVIYRPHAPMGIPRVCVPCIDAEALDRGGFVVTNETLADLKWLWRRKQLH